MSELDTKMKSNGTAVCEPAVTWDSRRDMSSPSASVYLAPPESSLRRFRDQAEIQAISGALTQTGWNRKRAAKLLSISYRGLLLKIRRYNICPTTGTRSATAIPDSKME
jgi:transcriptional regulator with GAF, ATPase, and Fis domain